MVETTQQDQVREVGAPTVLPVVNVVGFAVAGPEGAALLLAVPITHHQRGPQRVAHRAGQTTDIENVAPAGGDDPTDVAVTQDRLDRGA